MIRKLVFFPVATSLISGCSLLPDQRPRSVAEIESGYTYIPLDPQKVRVVLPRECQDAELDEKDLLTLLPDNAVRIGIQSFKADGKIEFGVGNATGERGLYKVTVDYVNADTIPVQMSIYVRGKNGEKIPFTHAPSGTGPIIVDRDYDLPYIGPEPKSEEEYIKRQMIQEYEKENIESTVYSIPAFVGVGVRVVADVVTYKSGVDITGLGSIGGGVKAGGLNGTMVAQTIGINGQKVAAAIPIQSSLDSTSVENALVAIGSVKTLLYDDATRVTPRVLGVYLPFPADKRLINAIVSQLSKKPIDWETSCPRATVAAPNAAK